MTPAIIKAYRRQCSNAVNHLMDIKGMTISDVLVILKNRCLRASKDDREAREVWLDLASRIADVAKEFSNL